jgi:hypothetical protein
MQRIADAISCGMEGTGMCPICFLTGCTIIAGTGSAVGLGLGIAKLIQRIEQSNLSATGQETAIPALDSATLSQCLDRCRPSL